MKIKIIINFIIIFSFLIPLNFSLAVVKLGSKLSGKILIQVEDSGKAWYVNPDNQKRVYLGRPKDAFLVMRKYGLGISNKDFESFRGIAPSRLKGKILLKVEDSGRAYYVNPDDMFMHFLGSPKDAFEVMKKLGLGITNKNLNEIQILEGEILGNNSLDFMPTLDSDGDNLSDAEEKIIGTNPYLLDTNGDGHDDLTEVLNGFDPNGIGEKITYLNKIINRTNSKIEEEVDLTAGKIVNTDNINIAKESFPVFSANYNITAKEKKLADIINDYREIKGLHRIPISRSLSFTAKMHVLDLYYNKPNTGLCNPHSWSTNDLWGGLLL